MKNKKLKCFIIFTVLVILISILSIIFIKKSNYNNYSSIDKTTAQLVTDGFTIENKGEDKIVATFTRANGIKTIEGENIPTISANNKKEVSVDTTIEPNKKYTYTVIDSNNNSKTESFTTPQYYIELTETNIDKLYIQSLEKLF